MRIDYEKRHIETETRFYQKMNKQNTFLLTLAIVGLGSFVLYMQYWSIKNPKPIDLPIWMLLVGFLFVFQLFIGYSIFEYERKKYTKL